ncbi:uncharacterized protein EURHEDRAFT_379221 [Aspergillus ruber CBS 135680]|uniref:Uncharacterized protein n=1 Tax=Aspergillus ruber (strain CBS 135680) TaxID=1388766 RepID=A0A017S9N2_ASPRC|nr:uncharacterized protein EURHEDRAFT_379221 [Aspergillus ruber CBS 135680]EYE93516.1 hypothetical protein EURHEDRAFT_379221 [Aspergillus ruber CBS 135680]
MVSHLKIYHFDETGFAMGLTATARVITRAEYYGRQPILQPGNREWVTLIEAINATGWALPSYLIFKGKVFIESCNSPSSRALNQLIKGSQLAMQAGAILAQENKDLRATNEKKKQKRARFKRQIAYQGGLSAEDVQQVIQGLNQSPEVEIITQMAAAAPATNM